MSHLKSKQSAAKLTVSQRECTTVKAKGKAKGLLKRKPSTRWQPVTGSRVKSRQPDAVWVMHEVLWHHKPWFQTTPLPSAAFVFSNERMKQLWSLPELLKEKNHLGKHPLQTLISENRPSTQHLQESWGHVSSTAQLKPPDGLHLSCRDHLLETERSSKSLSANRFWGRTPDDDPESDHRLAASFPNRIRLLIYGFIAQKKITEFWYDAKRHVIKKNTVVVSFQLHLLS